MGGRRKSRPGPRIDVRYLGGDHRVYLLSQFQDGGALLTANYPRPRQEWAGYLAHGVPTLSLAMLLAEHSHELVRFLEAGHVPLECATLEAIREAKRAYHHNPMIHRDYRRNNWSVFRVRVQTVGLIPVALGFGFMASKTFSPLASWLLAFGFAVGLSLLVGQRRSWYLHLMTAQQRQADARRKKP